MNYSYGELEEIFYKIENILNKIENINLDERTHLLFLANNDKIKVKINFLNIAHLLGINTEQLKLTGFYNGSNSYEILKDFVKKGAYQLHKLNKDNVLSYKSIFSPYIESKIDGFLENIKFNINETCFLCKYNSERSFTSSNKTQKYDYIIVKKLFDDRFGVICLVKNKYDYAPMSNQIFETKEALDEFLKENICNQEITILNGLSFKYDDYSEPKKFNLPLKLLIDKLNETQLIKKDFSCIIDTSYTLSFHLNKYLESNLHNDFETQNVDKLCKLITEGKFVDSNRIHNTNIKKIIDSYNEYVCKKDNINTNNTENYQKLKDELRDKKNKIIELEQSIQRLQKENELVLNENSEMNEKLLEFDCTRNSVIELLKKPKI